jgi:mRNA-degrading endonuclease RelE of RelBE toxin-antitoxin system
MTNTVSASNTFNRDAKPLLKKYKTLRNSLEKLIDNLVEDPFLGIPYGNDIYKVRLADPSKGGGKSGGFRVMYYHLNKTEIGIEVLLMFIYDKSEKSTIKKDEAVKRLKEILNEHNARG